MQIDALSWPEVARCRRPRCAFTSTREAAALLPNSPNDSSRRLCSRYARVPRLFARSFFPVVLFLSFFFPAVFCVSLLVEDDFTRFLRYVGVLWHGLTMLIEGSLFLTADPIFRFGLNFGELGWCLFVSCIFRIGAIRFSLGCVGCTFKI